MLDVRRLAMLREVALHGSITGAARALGASASGISQQITRLEREWSIALLEPAGRGVRLTAAAERLVGHTERILAVLEEAEAELEAGRGVPGGVVHLAAFHTFATGFLAAATQHLGRIAPEITLRFTQLDTDEAIGELLARRVDIAVVDEYPGYPVPPSPGLVRAELGREPIRVCLPAGAAPDPGATPWAMEPRDSDAFRWARATCRAAGFEPTVRFESPDPYVHRRMVEQGLAAAFLPASVAPGAPGAGDRGADAAGSLAGLPPDMHRTLLALVRRGTERAPAIRACRRAIELAAKDAAAGWERAG